MYCESLQFVTSADCSYLGGEQEFDENVELWIKILAKELVARDHHLDGSLLARDEDTTNDYLISVNDDVVKAEVFMPPCTYSIEWRRAWLHQT